MKSSKGEAIRADGHEVRITRPDKVLFPADGITKRDVVRYYQRIAPRMLPYLEGRPLALERFPDGIDEPGFFQKAVSAYYPSWIRTTRLEKAGGTVRHVVADDAATLVYLANQACLMPHTWLSRADRPHFPDQMVFDLDPSTEDLAAVIEGARLVREVLNGFGLPAYVRATGSRGLHVAVPLDREEEFDKVREFARGVAEKVTARDPDRFTLEQHKNKRRGRVFIDIARNAYAQTAVALYGVRARNGAPVSVPLEWDELDGKGFRPDGVTIKTVFDRLERIGDPWKNFWRDAASLGQARQKTDRARGAA